MCIKLDQGSIRVAGEDLGISTSVPLDQGEIAVAGNDLVPGLIDEVVQHLLLAAAARRADPSGQEWLAHWARAGQAVNQVNKLRRRGRPKKKEGEYSDEQITRYLAEGHTVKDTAVLFQVSEKTVADSPGRARRRQEPKKLK